MPKQKGMCIAVFAKHGASPKQAIWRSVVDLLAANAFNVLVCDSVLNRNTTKKTKAEDDHPNFEFASLDQIKKKAKIAAFVPIASNKIKPRAKFHPLPKKSWIC